MKKVNVKHAALAGLLFMCAIVDGFTGKITGRFTLPSPFEVILITLTGKRLVKETVGEPEEKTCSSIEAPSTVPIAADGTMSGDDYKRTLIASVDNCLLQEKIKTILEGRSVNH